MTEAEQVADLRARLGVDVATASDAILTHCITVARDKIDPYVTEDANQTALYLEGQQAMAVAVYQHRGTGSGGTDAAGEYDYTYLPPVSAIRNVWEYIGPLTRYGSSEFA